MVPRLRWTRGASAALLATLLVTACSDSTPTGTDPPSTPGPAAFDAGVPIAWIRLSHDLTRNEGHFPPPVARAYGYIGVTLWEAVAPGVPGGLSLAGQLNELGQVPAERDLHWPAVANAALASILRSFYTTEPSRVAIQQLETEFAAQFESDGISRELLERSAEHGQRVAAAIRAWSLSDRHTAMSNCPWTPPVGAGLWSPSPPSFSPAVEPCWGQLRTFVLSAPGQCAAAPHMAYSEVPGSEFHQEAMEVYETVRNGTEEERTIARFWADLAGESPTPAGHSMSMAAQALEQVDASLELAAETFARVGIGEADAFVACWATKYHYGLLRPIHYIHAMIDPDWEPVLETPPFPAYTSGHSNDVGASSTILTGIFGDGFAITDHTNDDRGFAPRSFGSFYEAADESAFSRLYGGIHFRMDIEQGIEQGRCVGRAVNALAFRSGAIASRSN